MTPMVAITTVVSDFGSDHLGAPPPFGRGERAQRGDQRHHQSARQEPPVPSPRRCPWPKRRPPTRATRSPRRPPWRPGRRRRAPSGHRRQGDSRARCWQAERREARGVRTGPPARRAARVRCPSIAAGSPSPVAIPISAATAATPIPTATDHTARSTSLARATQVRGLRRRRARQPCGRRTPSEAPTDHDSGADHPGCGVDLDQSAEVAGPADSRQQQGGFGAHRVGTAAFGGNQEEPGEQRRHHKQGDGRHRDHTGSAQLERLDGVRRGHRTGSTRLGRLVGGMHHREERPLQVDAVRVQLRHDGAGMDDAHPVGDPQPPRPDGDWRPARPPPPRRAAVELAQQQHPGRVEGVGGFIEDEQPWFVHEGTAQADALAVPLGECRCTAVGPRPSSRSASVRSARAPAAEAGTPCSRAAAQRFSRTVSPGRRTGCRSGVPHGPTPRCRGAQPRRHRCGRHHPRA